LYVNIRDVIEVERSENLSEKHGEKRNLDSTTNQNLMNLAESGGKKKKKKICVRYMECVEKLKKQSNFYAREGEIKLTFYI
jgi:hypothetical protein